MAGRNIDQILTKTPRKKCATAAARERERERERPLLLSKLEREIDAAFEGGERERPLPLSEPGRECE